MKKRLIGVILSAALLATTTLAGCGMNSRYVMTVNGENVAAGIYIMNQYYAAGEAQAKFAEAYPDVDMWADDFKPDGYEIEGVKYTDWVNQKAVDMTARMYAIENLFDERGLSFTQEQLSEFNTAAEARWNADKQREELVAALGGDEEMAQQYVDAMGSDGETYAQYFEKVGVSKESFKFMQMNDEKTAAIFASIYGPEGTDPVPEEEWLPVFKEDYVRVKVIVMSKTDEENNPKTQEQIDGELEFMQGQLEKVKEGGSFYMAGQSYYAFVYGIDENELYNPAEGLDEEPDATGEDTDSSEEEPDTTTGEEPDSGEEEADTTGEDNDSDGEEVDTAGEDNDSDEDEPDATDGDDDSDEDEPDTDDGDDDSDEGDTFDVYAEMDKELEQYIKISDANGNEFIEHVLAMDLDKPEIFESEENNYLIVRLDVLGREDVFPEYRDEITVALKSEEFDNMLTERANALLASDIKIDKKAIDRYSPKNFIVGK